MKHLPRNESSVALPVRAGPPPRTTTGVPQQQIDQIPSGAMHLALQKCLEVWPAVEHKPSLRAAAGTRGLFLSEADARGPAEAFLLGREFAHYHPLPDGALHMTLPPNVRRAAMDAGWAIPHPLAGQPTVSPMTVLVYAPRTQDELEVVVLLVQSAEAYAHGQI